jgi:YHS domain-containing protein
MTVKKVSPLIWGWWGTYKTSSELALQGYDPVSYFSADQPSVGTAEYSYDWGDVTWQFANAENMALFEQDPAEFAPQFGGFCSFAASKGFTADISPDAWHVEAGKLYVFADQNVRDQWVAALSEGSLEASTANWAKR